jgi:hypothetical protein
MCKRRLHMTQEETARWLGCSIEQMNADHDRLHAWFADATGQHSYSLDLAAKRPLTLEQHILANLEEDAILNIQRYLVACQRARSAGVQENG